MEQKKNKTVTIEVPYLPKSLNPLLRWNRFKTKRYYDKCKKDVWALAYERGSKRPKKPFQKAKIIMTFIFPNNTIRDFDNLIGGAKGMIDGIKTANIIEDDSWQRLEMEFKGELGKQARTIIEVQEVK